MLHTRKEGERLRCGINYTKTIYGHGMTLQLCLPAYWRFVIGYYWGKNFNYRFDIYNEIDEDKKMRESLR